MRLVVDKRVYEKVIHFYDVAIDLHPSLDEIMVLRKEKRLFESLQFLTIFPKAYGFAKHNQAWEEAGYREFICEDFHFAYTIRTLKSGEQVVLVVDAVHSLLYHE